MDSIGITGFLEAADHLPVADVRSPSEYDRGHIPGARLLSLFNDEERAAVGIAYKVHNRQTAVKVGLEIVGPKMAEFVRHAGEIAPGGELLLYCWRGGMRSQSMSWLMNTCGIRSRILTGGYKAYRRHIRSCLQSPMKMLLLGGYTGSGKTGILSCLEKMGQQTINLETLANHKGSAFGSIGQPPQPTTEQFENNLHQNWKKLDPENTTWIEDESKTIGRIQLPDELFRQMRTAPVIVINLPQELRISRLVREYSGYGREVLESGLKRISKRLGTEQTRESLRALEAKDFHAVARISLGYYDKAYQYMLKKRDNRSVYHINFPEDDPAAMTDALISFSREKKLTA